MGRLRYCGTPAAGWRAACLLVLAASCRCADLAPESALLQQVRAIMPKSAGFQAHALEV
jgi:hypothetical protein